MKILHVLARPDHRRVDHLPRALHRAVDEGVDRKVLGLVAARVRDDGPNLEEAEELLERRSGDEDSPRILGAFNEPCSDWLNFFCFA